jgi:hypothetical protein
MDGRLHDQRPASRVQLTAAVSLFAPATKAARSGPWHPFYGGSMRARWGWHQERASTPQAPWPAVGSSAVRRRAPAIPGPFVYDVFWLLSFGLYVSAPARRAPVPQAPPGPAVREMSLRRSCVAYFLREFPGPCPRVDRPPSATAPQAPPAAKKQRGEEPPTLA